MTHTYDITGMTCGGCAAKVKSELLKLGDVTGADVQLASPQATINMAQHIPLAALQQALSKAGSYAISAHEMTGMSSPQGSTDPAVQRDSYFPILLIVLYITGVSLLAQLGQPAFSLSRWMSHFMAGFFLVFSFFKLMNLRGFAEGYRSYDVIAKVIPAYGYIYPFIELALGLAFLTGFQPLWTNAITLIVMGVSTIGVARNLLKKETFQCACLGTVIKLPLSKVTLAEDLVMVAMSAAMLFTLNQ